MALRPYNVLSLCAGVGGLELGIRVAEPRAVGVCYVEREAAAAATLVARMEDGWLSLAPVWSDLGTFDARPWRGVVDCVASGDPCQPNSVAGRQLGSADDRWLLDRVLGIVETARPHRFFRENVPGNADGQIAALVPALEGMGYRVAAGIFSAAEVGASHRRERLFVMADRIGGGLRDQPEPVGGSSHPPQPFEPRAGVCQADAEVVQRGEIVGRQPDGTGSGVGDAALGPRQGQPRRHDEGGADVTDQELADGEGDDRRLLLLARRSIQARDEFGGRREVLHGVGLADASSPGLSIDPRERRDDGAELAALERDGLPLFAPGPSDPRWADVLARASHLEPAIRRVADGSPGRVDRLRALGNAVFPLAAAYAWRALAARLAEPGRLAVRAA